MLTRIQRHALSLFCFFPLVGFVVSGPSGLNVAFCFRSRSASGFIWFTKRQFVDETTRIQKDMQPFSRSVLLVAFGVRVRLGLTCLP